MKILEGNIRAAIELSDVLASTLGPNGMNKLLVDNINDTFVTKEGAVIVDKVEIKHPIAKLIGEVARTMEQEVGDGSTRAILLTGELLKKAKELNEMGMHPTTIIKGYELALKDSLKIMTDKAFKGKLREVINSTLHGDEKLTSIVLSAVKETDINNVLTIKKTGLSVKETIVIEGVALDKERVHKRMPIKIKNAKVIITKTPIEVRNTVIDSEIMINNPIQLKRFLDNENNLINKIVNEIINSGAKVVFCQKGIDDKAQELLARAGIIAIRRIREKDITALIKATNAKLISDLKSIKQQDLGNVIEVNLEKIGDERLTIIKGSSNIKTIIIRGSTEQVINEVERRVKNAIKVTETYRKNNNCLPGTGETELMLNKELNQIIKGKEQLSYQAFKQALKVINNTLKKNKTIMTKTIELLLVKKQALISATETTKMILRINGILKGK